MCRLGQKQKQQIKKSWKSISGMQKKLGAEIVMTHGENVPVQIAEYATAIQCN